MAFRLRSQGATFKEIGSSPALKHISPIRQAVVEEEPVLNQALKEVVIRGNKNKKFSAEKLDDFLSYAGMAPGVGVVPDLLNVVSNLGQSVYHGVKSGFGGQESTEARQRALLAGIGAMPVVGIGASGARLSVKSGDKLAAKILKNQKIKIDRGLEKALEKNNLEKIKKYQDEMATWQKKFDDFQVQGTTPPVATVVDNAGAGVRTPPPPGGFKKWWGGGSQVKTVTDPRYVTPENPGGIVSSTNSATNGEKVLKYALYLGGGAGLGYLLNTMRTNNADESQINEAVGDYEKYTQNQKDSAKNVYNTTSEAIDSSYNTNPLTVPIDPATGEPYGGGVVNKVDKDFD